MVILCLQACTLKDAVSYLAHNLFHEYLMEACGGDPVHESTLPLYLSRKGSVLSC